MPNGTPKRLTSASHFEFDPSFSKDGRYLTYVSWSDLDMGAIHIVDLQRRGRRGNINEPVKITSKKEFTGSLHSLPMVKRSFFEGKAEMANKDLLTPLSRYLHHSGLWW